MSDVCDYCGGCGGGVEAGKWGLLTLRSCSDSHVSGVRIGVSSERGLRE